MNELIRNESLTVGTTAIIISPQLVSGQRNVFTVVNTSGAAQVVTLSLGIPAQAGAGVVLYPTGTFFDSKATEFLPSNLAWYAIASAAGATIAIHERVV